MAYIGVSPSNGVRQKHTYTATASQTTFSGAGSEGISLSYRDSNYVDVYRNGVKLGDADYTATSGTSIVLGEGAAVNDIVEIVVYDVFSVADTVSKADGGTFDGNVAMAGTLAVTGAFTSQGIDDNADATAITIDSSERVAIGTTTNTLYYNSTSTYTSSLALKTNASNEVAEIAIINGNNNFGSTIDFARTNTSSNDVRFASLGGYADSNTAGSESGHIRFQTKGASDSNIAERMRITSSGNLGLGTSSPNEKLTISSGAISFLGDISTPSIGAGLFRPANNTLAIVTGSTERMRINSSGNVGIGLSSNIDRKLHVEVDNTYAAKFGGTAGGDFAIEIGQTGTNGSAGFNATGTGGAMKFSISGSEHMRIDSSGNLLVGKTSTSGDVVGHRLSSDGRLLSTADSNYALQLNRKTSDGDIAQFRKDGSTVGSIGTTSGVLTIDGNGANTGGFYFNGANNILPRKNKAFNSGTIDLGSTSQRWKDLYLSGGVYLGGTGSANKLDDYEEGTWTPTANTGLSYGFQQGRYIKVGNLVLASFDIDLDSVSASGNILQGLPFTTGNFGGNFGIVNIGYYSSITTGVVWLSGYTRTNLTSLYFTGNSQSTTSIQHNTFNVFNDTTRILGNLIYHSN